MSLKERVKTLTQTELTKGVNQLKEDSTTIGSITSEAITSYAYIYPFLGILYFFQHPKLFKSVKPILIKSIILSAIILFLVFFFTYLPQVALLAFVSGPLAFIGAIPIVFLEAWGIISFFNKTLLISSAEEKIFDAVLVQKGLIDLVEKGRIVKHGGSNLILGKSLLKPITGKFSTEGIVRYILTLPLNAIPGVGTAFFLLYNGSHSGPSYHSHYFNLKSFNSTQKHDWIEKNKGAYTIFGTTALTLNMIPIIGTFLGFSTTVGAALWAVEMEKKERGGKEIVEREEVGVVEVLRDEL